MGGTSRLRSSHREGNLPKDSSLSRERGSWSTRWRSSGNLDERAGVPGKQRQQTPLHKMRKNARGSRDGSPEEPSREFSFGEKDKGEFSKGGRQVTEEEEQLLSRRWKEKSVCLWAVGKDPMKKGELGCSPESRSRWARGEKGGPATPAPLSGRSHRQEAKGAAVSSLGARASAETEGTFFSPSESIVAKTRQH